jgi:hypothetical protein
MSKQNDVKEIDLLELFRLLGNGIKNALLAIIKAILFLFVFGIKKTHWISLFIIAGALTGWLYYSSTDRYYSSELIAQPNGISAVEMVEYINDLNKHCIKRNTDALSLTLQQPDSVAQKIKNIEAFYYIDVNGDRKGDFVDIKRIYNPEDTTKKIDNNKILVQVQVFDNKIFEKIKTGIFHYISSNPYLTKLNQIRINELKELISYTKIEVLKLDSLQNVEYFKTNSSFTSSNDNRLMFISEKDKQMYYKDKIILLYQKQEYIKELELATKPLTIIKDFTPLAIEENPKRKYIVGFGLWFGAVGYLLFLILRFKERINNYIK